MMVGKFSVASRLVQKNGLAPTYVCTGRDGTSRPTCAAVFWAITEGSRGAETFRGEFGSPVIGTTTYALCERSCLPAVSRPWGKLTTRGIEVNDRAEAGEVA